MNNYLSGFGEKLNSQYNTAIDTENPIFKTYSRVSINRVYMITDDDIRKVIKKHWIL